MPNIACQRGLNHSSMQVTSSLGISSTSCSCLQFGWEKSCFSQISQLTAMYIWTHWKHLLRFDPTCLTREKLTLFARSFKAKGSPLGFIAALIDGTLQKNARPVRNQRLVYNGWKHIHCLKYHVLISPDGLVIHIYGPVDGSNMMRQYSRRVGCWSSYGSTFGLPLENNDAYMEILHTQ